MNGMQLLVTGVGDAFSAKHYSSCFAVEAAGRWLMVDCPHPFRKVLREASLAAGVRVDADQIDALVLTHLHADHVSGLEGLLFYSRFLLERKLRLILHPQVACNLWSKTLAGGMGCSLPAPGAAPIHWHPEDFYEQVLLTEDQPVTHGPFTIHGRLAVHSVPAIALKIEANGRSLGYSGDTSFAPALIEWLAPCDLIIHEAGAGFFHTTAEQLLELPAELRRKLRLIHYPDPFDLDASAIEPLRQGRLYTVV
jgi:ribonuclease BN (tRNA processing enzyme)